MLKKAKALVLFSGGLDSMLVVKMLESQGIQTNLVSFTSFFFDASEAKKSAKQLNKRLKIIDISKKHLKIVLSPSYGYGKGLNPCTDCHLLMIKEAKKILNKKNFDFMATGEVVGQRPMSQKIHHLKLIEKKARLTNKILRPLSARVLDETGAEKNGLVDRKKLLSISGRSRKEQIKLIKKYGIKKYPSPAGGCILTDLFFAKRLKEYSENKKNKIGQNKIDLFRVGRHFIVSGARIVIGRNHNENEKIKKIADKSNILMEIDKIPGPITIIDFQNAKKTEIEKIVSKASRLTRQYSAKAKDLKNIKIKYWKKGKKSNAKFIII